jgi:hypothetical protein
MSKGNKYEATKSLDIKAIADLVRADIKAAVAEGVLLKGIKCNVRISRYSGGQSLNVTIARFPAQIETDESVSGVAVRRTTDRYTAIAQSTMHVIRRIMGDYNYDNSDLATDYFSVRFYGDVSFDHDLARADRDATEARLNGLVDLRLTDMAMAAAANF